MKKYFIFAAIATVGLFASCSSSDDVTANDAGSFENPDGRQAIRLNLATPGAMISRGTGTVGGVGTVGDANYMPNAWAGQRINVFMFTKGTQADPYATVLKLTETDASTQAAPAYFYDNQVMITPGTTENLIDAPAMQTPTEAGEAMIADGTINYYPSQGNYDFFGYHADDAVTNPVDKTTDAENLWTVPFTINGTQDLMSTKAALTGDPADGATQAGIMASASRPKDYYSAYSARKNVQPTLTFKHLLTRLQFSVKAGNDAAAGNEGGTPAVYYTEDEAYTANAGLTGARLTTDVKTPGTNYTASTAAAYNATLPGAFPNDGTYVLQTGEASTINTAISTSYNDGETLSADDANSYNATLGGAVTTSDLDPTTVVYYTKAECNEYNKANVSGAVDETDIKTPAGPATQNIANAVKVTSIQVLSENTKGDLAVAWTGDKADYEKITWDDNQPAEADRWLTLMERPISYKFVGTPTFTYADLAAYAGKDNAWYTALDANSTPTKNEVDNAVGALVDGIGQAVYNTLSTAGKAKYVVDNSINYANQNLIALTPTYPDTDLAKTKKVGESIILSPGTYDANGVAQSGTPLANTAKLRMKVALEQNVPTNWNNPTVRVPKTQEYELDIKAPDDGFKQNTSYNIILTVYGLERIEVIAVVEPWGDGGNLNVGQDD